MADQLEDGRVLSGVGGQYNFVAQGHALEGARSMLILRSWRESAGRSVPISSGSTATAPFPGTCADIVITEYGIADLRGQTGCQGD